MICVIGQSPELIHGIGQVANPPQSERETDVVHHHKLDDFGTGFEMLVRVSNIREQRNYRSGPEHQAPLTELE